MMNCRKTSLCHPYKPAKAARRHRPLVTAFCIERLYPMQVMEKLDFEQLFMMEWKSQRPQL